MEEMEEVPNGACWNRGEMSHSRLKCKGSGSGGGGMATRTRRPRVLRTPWWKTTKLIVTVFLLLAAKPKPSLDLYLRFPLLPTPYQLMDVDGTSEAKPISTFADIFSNTTTLQGRNIS